MWLNGVHGVMDRTVLRRIRRIMGDRLRCMVTGSAPIPKHLLEEFHALGWLVLEAYGLSENVLPMAMNRPDDFRLGTVGRPLQGNEIAVTEDSEIWVRGPGLFAGYVGDANPRPLDSDGFYRTGDLGRFDKDGYLIVSGRSDDMIKTSTGRRVAPASVEAELRSVSGIDQAVIFGAGRKCLWPLCTCVPAHPHEAASVGLERELRERVARMSENARPRGIALLDLPFSIEQGELTSNLKLKRAVIESRHYRRGPDTL
jgi:long-chain acyl-CoA synthetase